MLFSCYFLSLETGDLYPFVWPCYLWPAQTSRLCPRDGILFWTLVLTLPEICQRNGKNIKSICTSLSGQPGQFPSTCTTLKADLIQALAFSPPHLFRSKSSHSTESLSLSFLLILPILSVNEYL